jgi:hypothetical protein
MLVVIPAKAGTQALERFLDPGFRRGDGSFIDHFILQTCTLHFGHLGIWIACAGADPNSSFTKLWTKSLCWTGT